jgi:hypothetical protein
MSSSLKSGGKSKEWALEAFPYAADQQYCRAWATIPRFGPGRIIVANLIR